MSALRRIIAFARSVDVAAVRREIAELKGVGGGLEVLARAAAARDGREMAPAAATGPGRCQNGSLADRIEQLLTLHQPRRPVSMAEDLRTSLMVLTASMEAEPDRFRLDRDGWRLVQREARL